MRHNEFIIGDFITPKPSEYPNSHDFLDAILEVINIGDRQNSPLTLKVISNKSNTWREGRIYYLSAAHFTLRSRNLKKYYEIKIDKYFEEKLT